MNVCLTNLDIKICDSINFMLHFTVQFKISASLQTSLYDWLSATLGLMAEVIVRIRVAFLQIFANILLIICVYYILHYMYITALPA